MTPIVVPHDVRWASAFAVEAARLAETIGENGAALHHIGSASIPGILAKPINDMLGVVGAIDALDDGSARIELLGYTAMGEYGIEGRRYFRKDDAAGRRSHHLHIFEAGSPCIERHLAFRDYLRSHPDKAAEYSALKAAIVSLCAPYQDAKNPFVERTLAQALNW